MFKRRKKILVVDNDVEVLIALERVLEEAGFDTSTAWNLPEGLGALAVEQFDLLLVGDHPPEVNCQRLLKTLRRESVAVPCIVLHSTARHPFALEYLRHLGAAGVACKWDYAEVVGAVRDCLRQPLTAAEAMWRVVRPAS